MLASAISGAIHLGKIGESPKRAKPYGIYPRILRKFVFDRRTIDLPFAIRAMTSLPASIIGLTDRGMIREGNWADLALFDPLTLRDNATYLKPHIYPTGIRDVLVNGVLAVDEGKVTNAVAGRMLTPRWTK